MLTRFLRVVLLLPVAVALAGPQPHASTSPKREVRAVWLATAAGLDWPRTTESAEQQASLRGIVHLLKTANFNTIFFQVRSRGDAYYRSSYEPWPENLSGTPGKDPGWDPLGFLLDEAHAAGIEVHAWFNVFKVGKSRAHPEWTINYQGEGWLDPGLPEVRMYLVNLVLELARNYDVDGVNFDYLRYPGRDFADMDSYKKYGGALSRDDWRKANLDNFVTECYDRLTALRPTLKVGCSPLGIFGSDPDFVSGPAKEYYQDARTWLRNGKLDYVSPQVYWDIGAAPGNPDYAVLVRGWQRIAAGRHVYAGIGAYKADIARQIPAQIDTARNTGTAGQAYFRFENVRSLTPFEDRYAAPALIPPMPWKAATIPPAPLRLAVTEISPNVLELEWILPAPAARRERYSFVVYRWNSQAIPFDDPRAIATVTPTGESSCIDTVHTPTGVTYFYAVAALDRDGNEGPPSPVTSGTMREFLALRKKITEVTALSAVVPPGGGAPHLIAYMLSRRTPVTLEVLSTPRDAGDTMVTTVVSEMQEAGTYVVGLSDVPFGPGRHVVRLRTGDTQLEQPFDLMRVRVEGGANESPEGRSR